MFEGFMETLFSLQLSLLALLVFLSGLFWVCVLALIEIHISGLGGTPVSTQT